MDSASASASACPSSTPTAASTASVASGGIVELSPVGRAGGGSRDVTHSSDSVVPHVSSPLVTPGSSPATPTVTPRELPQLLEACGIGGWPPVSRQKAWAQLVFDRKAVLSAHDPAFLRVLEINALDPAGQLEWLRSERDKVEAAALTKKEREVLQLFALKPSQTVDKMLRALDDHKSFSGCSSKPLAARYDFVKERENELPAIFPLKGDREFLMRQLKEFATKPAAPPGAVDSAPPAPSFAPSTPHTSSMAKVTLGGKEFGIKHPEKIDCSKIKKIPANECVVLGELMKTSDFTVETLNLVRFFCLVLHLLLFCMPLMRGLSMKFMFFYFPCCCFAERL
jgi:hypothetical protein